MTNTTIIIDGCQIGSNNEKIIENVAINSNHSKFSEFYTFQSNQVNTTYFNCCLFCLKSFCFIFDFNKITKECKMWKPKNQDVTGYNDANISRIFFVDNSQHISGYYYSIRI